MLLTILIFSLVDDWGRNAISPFLLLFAFLLKFKTVQLKIFFASLNGANENLLQYAYNRNLC